jgi:3',5'-nucleoside bisphosphate phosphatase
MHLDLHLHSTASDGRRSPAEVVEAAIAGALDVIALTDHDTVAGFDDALKAARGRSIDVIPGIEVSSSEHGSELHILGYFIDPASPGMRRHAERAGTGRAARLEAMVERLRLQGVEVSFDAVLEQAGDDVASLGRPHLARELERVGYVDSLPEAFDRFIGNGHPAYIPTDLLDPGEAISLIRESGGVAVWAHPPMSGFEERLGELVKLGLQGVEVYRPRNSPRWVRKLLRAAAASGLLVSGGSDWHGPDDGVLGDFHVTGDSVQGLLDAGRVGGG